MRHHWDSGSHLLVVGGRAVERRAVALSFHGASGQRQGPFVPMDCRADQRSLREALGHWLTGIGPTAAAHPLWSAERGTLYLESVGSLSRDAQQMLLAFVDRGPARCPLAGDGWSGRLAVGDDQDPWDLVADGRMLGALADALDKIRIELDPAREGGAA